MLKLIFLQDLSFPGDASLSGTGFLHNDSRLEKENIIHNSNENNDYP